ncbi:MAG: hypothetical protein M3186_09625, partial [Actinomycetota bacterium]|nr:hypothetical protein [Actinomycetota bacterium]
MVVGEADAKLAVNLPLVCWVGAAQGVQQATERVHYRVDVVSAHPSVRTVPASEGGQPGLRERALLLHLLAPCHHQ